MLSSVIIPHLDNFDKLNDCIEALNRQKVSRNTYEIILIDNGSIGFDKKKYENLVDKIIIYTDFKDPYNCRNEGIKLAVGDVLAFLDAKCIPNPDWLAAGINCINEGYELVGGHFELLHGDDVYTKSYQLMFLDNYQLYKVKAGFPGGNIFIKRDVIDKVGLFRTNLRSGEDIRWTKSIIEYGFKSTYCDKAVVSYIAKSKNETLTDVIRQGKGMKKIYHTLPIRMLLPMNPIIFFSKVKRFNVKFSTLDLLKSYFYLWQIRLTTAYAFLFK